MTIRTSAILLFSLWSITFGGCSTIALPDLVVKDFKSTVVNSEMIYFVEIRNIGNVDTFFGDNLNDNGVKISFNISDTPTIPADHLNQLPGSGNYIVSNEPNKILKPNEVIEVVYKSGKIQTEVLRTGKYAVATLQTSPENDGNTSNNINITPILKPLIN